MVKPVNIKRACLAAGLLVLAVAAAAETLTDPTRPPAALMPALTGAQEADAGPALQSVLVSRGRRIAIISGKEVRVNDKFGDARVVRITDTEVVLRSGKEVQTLKLFPDVEKRTAQRASRKDADKQGRKRQVKE